MCIAILAKPGVKLPADLLRQAFTANRHGAGIAFVRAGKVVIQKGFFDSELWVKRYEEVYEEVGATSPIVLHARIATLGRVCRENCHPFNIKNGALVHNGVLWSSTFGAGQQAEKSDTREFAERMHNNLTFDDVNEDKSKVEKAIGYNKMVLLYDDGRYIILNEQNGSWDPTGNVWFSNMSYRNAQATPSKTSESDLRGNK
jgi:predicted glutamine amidotransferase